jgi:hypothetical protein
MAEIGDDAGDLGNPALVLICDQDVQLRRICVHVVGSIAS